jgi:hypothetical protein
MDKAESSKIRVNGRPKMGVTEKKATTIQIRVNAAERAIFENLHQRFGPHLSEAEFARIKILDGNVSLFGIRDLPEKERAMLKEIALLGNQFKMVASRKNITLTQERQFREDSQKIREVLDSTHQKLLEYQRNELHYSKICTIIENLQALLFKYEASKDEAFFVHEITLIHKKLTGIHQSILTDKK